MAKVILITGGCRSGKSAHAQRLAESAPGRRAFVATAPALDDEMRQRIARHREQRRRRGWDTIEETVELAPVLDANSEYDVLLVDCLTLWINNLMYDAEQQGRDIEEEEIARAARQVVESSRRRTGTVIFVTNEVGMGIIPDNPPARRYGDLVGRCNQVIAAGADEVTLVVSGIATTLKARTKEGAPAPGP